MEAPPFVCICGRSFDYQNAFSHHTRSCNRSKHQISANLLRAREIWNEKQDQRALKRQKLESQVSSRNPTQANASRTTGPAPTSQVTNEISKSPSTTAASASDLHLSIAQGRGRRIGIPKPKRYRDQEPEPVKPASRKAKSATSRVFTVDAGNVSEGATTEAPGQPFETSKNAFHLFRRYATTPSSHDPDSALTKEDLCDFADGLTTRTPPDSRLTIQTELGPYPNHSSFLLGEWFWNAKSKSLKDFQSLIDILSAESFSIDDVRNTCWASINNKLGGADPSTNANYHFLDSGWQKEEVIINVPFNSYSVNPGPQSYFVGNFYHRSIIAILKERLSSDDSRHFHLEPFELLWAPPGQETQKVYGELYSSKAFSDEHTKLQRSPRELNCKLPRVVAALILASDETHLTQFGNTSLYPLYLYFGNFSKYVRTQPSRHLCDHLAYFVKLPSSFKDYFRTENGGRPPGDSVPSHCLREALHTQWKCILDDEFMEAYRHGVVIKCGSDHTERRFYPRIFMFSADYKEKIHLAGIRSVGDRPCTRCLIKLEDVPGLGTVRDRLCRVRKKREDNEAHRSKLKLAQDLIYKMNYAVKSKKVENLLCSESLVPSQNAFSQHLSEYGFNRFGALVSDVMHEVEGGTWEALYNHLLRILDCVCGNLKNELDQRYRETPTFGRDTIRKFRRNASQVGHMAMREWEDLLQCALPAFEDLIPEPFNSEILDLLYVLGSWHGLAKLRLHTEDTLNLLDRLTTDFGRHLRKFKLKTCAKHNTKELAREVAARNRQKFQQALKNTASAEKFPPELHVSDRAQQTASSSTGPHINKSLRNPTKTSAENSSDSSQEPKPVEFSLLTYKLHAMGDYVGDIRKFGTLDSYSTESGELEHRTAKANYARTSKKDYIEQMTRIERRQARIRRIRESFNSSTNGNVPKRGADMDKRYLIGASENHSFHIGQHLHQHAKDPSIKNFYTHLKVHLADRMGLGNADQNFYILRDRVYTHKTIRFNYTTYDVRRSQDLVNPETCQCNVMMLSQSSSEEGSSHPFVYARVLGIFHVNVVFKTGDPTPNRLDILWVRWYSVEPSKPRRLQKLRLYALDQQACGFVNPSDIVRGCHIIPAFADGRRYIGPRISVSKLARDHEDWNYYYVGKFSDRDLLMRSLWGLGVGHIPAVDGATWTRKEGIYPDDDNDDFEIGQAEQAGQAHQGQDIDDDLNIPFERPDEDPHRYSGSSDDDLDDYEFADKYSILEE